jgi:hypothetical protein
MCVCVTRGVSIFTPSDTPNSPLVINRAPVLTLWIAVVASRKGYGWDTALSFGRSITSKFAQSKAESMGVITKADVLHDTERRRRIRIDAAKVIGQTIEVVWTKQGMRACDSNGNEVNSGQVDKYVKSAFGEHYDSMLTAMNTLAGSYPTIDLLEADAYALYTHFRPSFSGWGSKSILHKTDILALLYTEERPPLKPLS